MATPTHPSDVAMPASAGRSNAETAATTIVARMTLPASVTDSPGTSATTPHSTAALVTRSATACRSACRPGGVTARVSASRRSVRPAGEPLVVRGQAVQHQAIEHEDRDRERRIRRNVEHPAHEADPDEQEAEHLAGATSDPQQVCAVEGEEGEAEVDEAPDEQRAAGDAEAALVQP